MADSDYDDGDFDYAALIAEHEAKAAQNDELYRVLDSEEDGTTAPTKATSASAEAPPAAAPRAADSDPLDSDFALLSNVATRTKCPSCRMTSTHSAAEADLWSAFPVPTRLEALLGLIGSQDIAEGTPRSNDDLIAALVCLRRLIGAAMESPEGFEISFTEVDVANLTDDTAEGAILRLARIPGAIDFLVAAGFERVGTTIGHFPESRSSSSDTRSIIAVALLDEELDALECEKAPRRIRTNPTMSDIGKHLTLFQHAEKLQNTRNRYPTFDDLLRWINLRNYFYCCVVVGGALQMETWYEYYETCREACQDTLDRVAAYHRTMKIDGSLPEVLRHGNRLRDGLDRLGILDVNASTRTPPPQPETPPGLFCGHSSPSANPLYSPGDYLTRTPPHGPARDAFMVSMPPGEEAWRDPTDEAAGLLNIDQCCYVNALLQWLFRDTPFVTAVMAFPRDPAAAGALGLRELPEGRVVRRLQAVFAFLGVSASAAINPHPLLDALSLCDVGSRFGDGQQHDPHEFAAALLEAATTAFEAVVKAAKKQPAQQPTNISKTLDAAFAATEEDKENGGAPEEQARKTTADTTLCERLEAAVVLIRGRALLPTAAPHSLAADGKWNHAEPKEDDSTEHPAAPAFVPMYPVSDEDPAGATTLPANKHQDPMAMGSCAESTEAALTDVHRRLEAQWNEFRDVEGAETVGCIHRIAGGAARGIVCYVPSRCSVTTAEKDTAPFTFPSTLDLASFGDSVSEAVATDRRQAVESRQIINEKAAEAKKLKATAEALKVAVDTAPKDTSMAEELGGLYGRAVAGHLAALHARHTAAADLQRIQSTLFGLGEDVDEKENSADSTKLHLASVVVHIGTNSSQGHYFSYVRDVSATEPKWLRCDDTRVEEVPEAVVFSEVTQRNAYLLAYRRPDHRPAKSPVTADQPRSMWSPLSVLKASNNAAVDEDDDVVPRHLRELVEKEDLRRQLKYAHRMSAAE